MKDMKVVDRELYGADARNDIPKDVEDHNAHDVVDHDMREDVNEDHEYGESLLIMHIGLSMMVIMPGGNECSGDLLLHNLSFQSMRDF